MTTLIVLSALGLVCLFSEIFGFRKILHPLVLAGLVAAFVTNTLDWNNGQHLFNEMMIVDNYSTAFMGLLIGITFIWCLMSPEFFVEPSSEADHFALIIFSLIGAMVMVTFSNMIMLFLGIEILSISLYILAGSNKTNLASNEAALKYFLMGAFATGFLLFGIALIYGVTGSFNLEAISSFLVKNNVQNSAMMMVGILMMMIALSFKVSAAPFHFWAPDVYQGSPTVITAFMSTVVKTAAFAAFFRLFLHTFNAVPTIWAPTLMIISGLTILVGNITAVYQTNFKRMLAYSSISHAGYMVLALLAMNASAPASLLYYTTAYSVSSITAFAILLLISHKTGNDDIRSFNGLVKRNPFLAAVTVVAMLSLAGIPPTAGFFAKYYIFSSAIQNGYIGLVLLAILGSLIGVFYYFRVIIAVFKTDDETQEIAVNPLFGILLALTSLAALVLGIAPGILAGLI
ncbi:MAG: NADH-quinone oxidoreductase subunit N [Bacteroidetes bacterium]|nr:NADH-quinone oxidoreductase subunit N [Bacteroidota bacterium]MBL0065064.1 NADH-quinone oxidoreductase subunit N [Bacteroidota bacterium]MBL0136998.1 NADH-quinone oxidoreductase subunit N [Bacteroidota bacterium]